VSFPNYYGLERNRVLEMIAGLVVAGGKSKRFGSDKRFYKLSEKTLTEIACEKISKVFRKNYIVVDKNFSENQIDLDRFTILRDLEDGKGPLMGIYSALSQIPEEGCLVIPVDMPNLSISLLEYINEQARFFDIIVPCREKALPLPGFYSKKLLPLIRSILESESFSMQSLVNQAEKETGLKVLKLSSDFVTKFGDPEKFLLNINRKDDIDKLESNCDRKEKHKNKTNTTKITNIKLQDLCGRNVEHLRISLTDRCNLKCFYCIPRYGFNFFERSNILSIEEIEYLVRFFYDRFGIRKIRFTGGEPLLRRGIETLFLSLSQIEDLSLHITTNGILIEDKIEILKSAGIKVNVSLDTLNPDKFKEITRLDLLRKVIKGIDILIENKIPIKLNTVALKEINDNEIFDLIDFARKREIVLRFIELMPLNGEYNHERNFISEEEIKERISKLYELEFLDVEGAARIYKLSNGAKVGFISTISYPGCQDCSRIRITADGRIVTCMFDSNSYSIKTFLRPINEEELFEFIRRVILKKPPGYLYLKRKGVNPLYTMRKLGG